MITIIKSMVWVTFLSWVTKNYIDNPVEKSVWTSLIIISFIVLVFKIYFFTLGILL